MQKTAVDGAEVKPVGAQTSPFTQLQSKLRGNFSKHPWEHTLVEQGMESSWSEVPVWGLSLRNKHPSWAAQIVVVHWLRDFEQL